MTPFSFPVRVYYEDTDAGGVYYANYLKFMERARTERLAALEFPLAVFPREHGMAFVVHHLEIDYLTSARLNDALDVAVEPVLRGVSPPGRPKSEHRSAKHEGRPMCRLVATQEVRRGPVALTKARVALACVETARWKPARMPKPLLEVLENMV